MAEHNELGIKGEMLALEYLKEKGYKILETNWKCGKKEIDIIALTDDYLLIIEVKTRSTDAYGEPQEFVTVAKQRFLTNAAQIFAEHHNIQQEVRFDIISIVMNDYDHVLNHLEDAFYPVLMKTKSSLKL